MKIIRKVVTTYQKLLFVTKLLVKQNKIKNDEVSKNNFEKEIIIWFKNYSNFCKKRVSRMYIVPVPASK